MLWCLQKTSGRKINDEVTMKQLLITLQRLIDTFEQHSALILCFNY